MTRIDKIFYASGAPVTTDSLDQAMIVFRTRERQSRDRCSPAPNRCRNLLSQLIERCWLFPGGTILLARYIDIELTAQLIAGVQFSRIRKRTQLIELSDALFGTHQISIVSHSINLIASP